MFGRSCAILATPILGQVRSKLRRLWSNLADVGVEVCGQTRAPVFQPPNILDEFCGPLRTKVGRARANFRRSDLVDPGPDLWGVERMCVVELRPNFDSAPNRAMLAKIVPGGPKLAEVGRFRPHTSANFDPEYVWPE